MTISTLTVVNSCLGLLGELPINDLDAFHPVVPKALTTLSTENSQVQASMWYFNTEYLTLVPQTGTNQIILPGDTLAVDALASRPRVAMRDGILFNLDDGTDQFTQSVKVRLHREIPFDHLPMLPRAYIAACTRYAFQLDIDGDATKTQQLRELKQQALVLLNAEHTRQEQANMLLRPLTALRLQRIVGHRNILRGY